MHHLSVSIAGWLKNHARSKPNRFTEFEDDDRGPLMVSEVRAMMKMAQSEGKRVLPCGKCDNFDFQSGCLGHVTVGST
jgi:hypothetical protein